MPMLHIKSAEQVKKPTINNGRRHSISSPILVKMIEKATKKIDHINIILIDVTSFLNFSFLL